MVIEILILQINVNSRVSRVRICPTVNEQVDVLRVKLPGLLIRINLRNLESPDLVRNQIP